MGRATGTAMHAKRCQDILFDRLCIRPAGFRCPHLLPVLTVWGIMARDLIRETERMNAQQAGAESGRQVAARRMPSSISGTGLGEFRVNDFIRPTSWPTIDIMPSCTNTAFVEFASAQYRHLSPDWSFFAAVSR